MPTKPQSHPYRFTNATVFDIYGDLHDIRPSHDPKKFVKFYTYAINFFVLIIPAKDLEIRTKKFTQNMQSKISKQNFLRLSIFIKNSPCKITGARLDRCSSWSKTKEGHMWHQVFCYEDCAEPQPFFFAYCPFIESYSNVSCAIYYKKLSHIVKSHCKVLNVTLTDKNSQRVQSCHFPTRAASYTLVAPFTNMTVSAPIGCWRP